MLTRLQSNGNYIQKLEFLIHERKCELIQKAEILYFFIFACNPSNFAAGQYEPSTKNAPIPLHMFSQFSRRSSILGLQQQLAAMKKMDREPTTEYIRLLKDFYSIVSRGHRQQFENYSKLEAILEDLGQIQEVRQSCKAMKRKSLQTECSISELASRANTPIACKGEQNGLFYTFYPQTASQPSEKNRDTINFKYRNPSIYPILLYAIFFNHLYMQTLGESSCAKIAHIFNHNHQIIEQIEIILTSMLYQRGEADDNESKAIRSVIALIREGAHDRETLIKQELRHLIETIGSGTIRQIFMKLADNLQDSQTIHLERLSSRGCRGESQEGARPVEQCEVDPEEILQKLAKQLKIRIKLQMKSGKRSWGDPANLICFLTKKSSGKGEYYLKQISYYSEESPNHRCSGQSLSKKFYPEAQFIDI